MRNSVIFLAVLLSACAGQSDKAISPQTNVDTIKIIKPENQTEVSWLGSINKTPVFLHYSLHDKVIIGEIIYLNTKSKTPIKLLGTIEEDKGYRLLEFENDGNISGIITGNPEKQVFNGSWFSPKSRKELKLKLALKDTSIESADFAPNYKDIFGTYHYQYSEEGYSGDFEIKKLNHNKVAFNIISVTGAPGYNVAEVPNDTIQMTGNNFIYKLPDTDSCEFKVTFYKDFLFINYTKGYCIGQFGMNATVDGIFLKVQK